MKRISILIAVILLMTSLPAFATTYYVRLGGSDSNLGTSNTDAGAWQTIGKCSSTMVAGDSCNVQAGTYNERVTSMSNAGSAGNLITYLASGTVNMKGFVINKNYIVVNGFNINNCGSVTGCIDSRGDYVQILNNTVNSAGNTNSNSGYGVAIGYAMLPPPDHVTVSGNHIYNTAGSTFHMILVATNSTVSNNEFGPGNNVEAILGWGHDNHITGNYFHDYTVTGVTHVDMFQTYGDCGAAWCQTAYNFWFERNFLINIVHDMFMVSNDNRSTLHDLYFINNIIVSTGIQSGLGCPYTYVLNNTFIDVSYTNQNGVVLFDNSAGEDSSNTTVANNLIIQTYNQPPYSIDPGSLPGRVMDYNYATYRSGSNYNAISGWSETHGVNGGNPYLANYTGSDACGTFNWSTHTCSNFDLHLTANSTRVIGKGNNYSSIFTTDYDGNARPATGAWDIGAYQYGSGSSNTTLTVTEAGTGTGTVTSSLVFNSRN